MLPDRFSPTQPHLLSNRIIVLHDPMYEYSTHALATRPMISRPNIYTRLNNDFLTLHYYSRPNIDVHDPIQFCTTHKQGCSTHFLRPSGPSSELLDFKDASRPTKKLRDPQRIYTTHKEDLLDPEHVFRFNLLHACELVSGHNRRIKGHYSWN